MKGFEGGDFRFVLQGEADIIQPIEQAMTHEFVDGEFSCEAPLVPHLALLEVNRQLVVFDIMGPPHQFIGLILRQAHREEAVLRAVIGEYVRERGRDNSAETEIGKRPHRVFARGAATKIPPCYQNARARVTRLVQDKIRVLFPVCRKPPVVKQKLPKASALDPLEKLFGNNLVSVDIHTVKGSHTAAMTTKRFHGLLSASARRC